MLGVLTVLGIGVGGRVTQVRDSVLRLPDDGGVVELEAGQATSKVIFTVAVNSEVHISGHSQVLHLIGYVKLVLLAPP